MSKGASLVEATRRDVLKMGGLGALGAVGAAALPWGATLGARDLRELPVSMMPHPFERPFMRPPVLRPIRSARDAEGVMTDYFVVVERAGQAEIVKGMMTPVFGYDGIVPGPTINMMQGRRAVLRVINRLPQINPLSGQDFTTSVHLHGSASLPQYDGYASDVTPPGFYKDYHYPNIQPARTLWYHDHGVHHTAQNAYVGLLAHYHLHDEAEMDLLPQGEFDVPVTVSDVNFARDGDLAFSDNGTSGVMGDVVLVNGHPWPVMKVKRRVYRFRFLVADVARSYRFGLDNGDPVHVVASDGGLMPRSREIGSWRHGMAERYEVLIDFGKYRPGQRIEVRNLGEPNNVDFANTNKVMAFEVTDEGFSKADPTWNRIPDTLVNSRPMALKEADATRTRHDVLKRSGGEWKINDKTWEDVINSDFQLINADPELNSLEIWEMQNGGGGWFHPAHIHLVDFRILDRDGKPPFDFELAPKDTAYLGEGETVRVLVEFEHHRGRYMVHCHNLSHEDHDMMVQYAVGWKPGDPDPNDPILAAPPKPNSMLSPL